MFFFTMAKEKVNNLLKPNQGWIIFIESIIRKLPNLSKFTILKRRKVVGNTCGQNRQHSNTVVQLSWVVLWRMEIT